MNRSGMEGRFPLFCFGGPEDRFDDRHVFNGVLNRDGDFGVVENGAREGVALQRVLVADWEGLDGDAAAEEVCSAVDEQARGAVGGSVDRDLELDAALG